MAGTTTTRNLKKVAVFGAFAVLVVLLWRTQVDFVNIMFLWLLVVPALFGVAIALAMRFFGRPPVSSTRVSSDSFTNDRPADVINASRIRVAGIGGLGFVAMAAAVAYAVPRIGDTVVVGAIGGVLAAALVIWYRRRQGPLSTNEPGGRAYLVSDGEEEVSPAVPRPDEREGSARRLRGGEAASPTRA